MKKFLTLLFIFTSSLAFSMDSEHFLADVISGPENNLVHKFFLKLDENNDVLSLIIKTDDETQEIGLEKIVEGIVLYHQDGFDVITLECPTCDSVHGGEINFKYLYSALSKKYRDFKIDLVRDGESWILQKSQDKVKINALKLVARKFLGRIIGIKNILVNP